MQTQEQEICAKADNSNNRVSNYPTKASQRRNIFPNGFSCILAYLEIGYFFAFIPFRCKFDVSKGIYEIVEFLPQRILTITIHLFLTTYLSIWFICLLAKDQLSGDSLRVFRISEAIFDFSYTIIFTYSMIFKKNDYKVFLNLAQKYHLSTTNGSTFKKYSLVIGISIVYIVLGTLYMWYSDVIMRLYRTGEVPSSVLQNYPTSFFLRVLDFGVGHTILFILLSFWRAVGESTSVLLFGFGWYLKQICEDLSSMITTEEASSKQILEQYLYVKRINQSINSITKCLIFVFVIGSIPFISQGIMDLSVTEPRIVLKLICTGFGFLITLLGGAEANSKANQLKNALLERQFLNFEKDVDLISLQMLLSEFSTPEIGLKGMHLFTVTYSFVGVMLSQCIVYALIILQLK